MRKSKTKNGQKIALGATILIVSGMLCKALGAFFRLPLTNLLGVEGIGVFQLQMSLFAFALVVASGGVSTALSKLVSSARAKGRIYCINIYLKRAFFVCCTIALALGLVFVLFAQQISALQGVENGHSYLLFILLLPLGAALAVLRGFFQGFENMFPTAISQVVEQIFKFAFGLFFAAQFARRGIFFGVFGAFLGLVLSELVAFAYLFFVFLAKTYRKPNQQIKTLDFREVKFLRRQFDCANFPLMLSAATLPLVSAFDALVTIPLLKGAGFTVSAATKLFGIQTGIVGTFLNFPLVISVSVATALLPNISYQISRGLAGSVLMEKGLKILLLLLLPTTFGLVAVFQPLFGLLYASFDAQIQNISFQLMFFGAFSIIFYGLMQYLVMLLQANGQFKYILLIMFISAASKATLTACLAAVPQINIFAITIGNLCFGGLSSILALWKLKKLAKFQILSKELFLLIFATTCMFLAVYTFQRASTFHPVLTLFLAVLIGIVVYGVFSVPVSLAILKKRNR